MYIPLPKDIVEESEKRFNSLPEEPARMKQEAFDNEIFTHGVNPIIVEGNMIDPEQNLKERNKMLGEVSIEPVDFAMERAIGKNDSVYSNFAELIIESKKKVGRIEKRINDRALGHATGFLISPMLLLTNWHVFQNKEEVGTSVVQFYYELDFQGKPKQYVTFKLNPSAFFHSKKELDYCVVAVDKMDVEGKVPLDQFGFLYLDPNLGKLGNENEEALNIIHHPGGDYQQLSIRENIFKKITPTSIWYETDTAKGSSGSPVFNDQWQVVALHHSGVPARNREGRYINKEGKPIPVYPDGSIDASQIDWIANEGIRISVILSDVNSAYPSDKLLEGLTNGQASKSSSNTPVNQANNQSSKSSTMENNQIPGNVNISFPATLVEKNGVINISINQGQYQQKPHTNSETTLTPDELDLFEIKKLEESYDFSECKGYQAGFLGSNHTVHLPMPKSSIRKYIAKVNSTDSFELKYFHYSVIFHTVRMMPILSAINVDGDEKKRKDETERKDKWLRDRRISFDVQLDDAYYKKSGFDRGHMSRREDANWGLTPEDAKRNADLTCMHTNACPQIKTLNRSKNKGIWGKLENTILERGALNEASKTRKITVFNGPIFKDSDPVYKGIQVPLEFFKIVLWLTDYGKLKATAFKISQINLVGDIDFEQLDIDQNVFFKQYQCSIKNLEKETDIDFGVIIGYDTFEGDENEDIEITKEISIISHIDSQSKQ